MTKAEKSSFQTAAEVEVLIRDFRTTVEHNIVNHAKPTLAECKATFKLLPHFDWTKGDDYYIRDVTGGKIVLMQVSCNTCRY